MNGDPFELAGQPKETFPLKYPVGIWTVGGGWEPNPHLRMSREEQGAHNIKAGYSMTPKEYIYYRLSLE